MRLHSLVAVAAVWGITLTAWVLAPRQQQLHAPAAKAASATPTPDPVGKAPDADDLYEDELPSLEAQVGTVPSVEGKITTVAVSPDGQRVAFLLRTGKGRFALGLYNLPARLLLADVPLPFPFEGGELAWSTDSIYVAPRNLGNGPLLDRDGRPRQLRFPKGGAADVIWPSDRPGRFVYSVGTGDGYKINEHTVTTDADRVLRSVEFGNEMGPALHVVGGHPVFVDEDINLAFKANRWVHVRRVADGRELFRLRLPSDSGPDGPGDLWRVASFSVSPNARYFFASFSCTADTLDIMALTQDAGEVLNRRRIATHYLRSLNDGHSVRWVKSDRRWLALLQSYSGKVDGVVDPGSGSQYTGAFSDAKALDFLPNGEQVGVVESGLALGSNLAMRWYSNTLLLAVRKPPRAE